MRWRRVWAWVGLSLLLASCAAPLPRATEEEAQRLWEARRQALAALEAWTLTGRVAVKTEDQGWNATILWRQHPRFYDLRIVAPLGAGTLQLRGDPAHTVLRTSEGVVYEAADAEALLREYADLALPVNSLRHWVLGLPDPAADSARSLDGRGRLARLRQHGWEIDFLGYRPVDRVELPVRMMLDNGEIEVRLAVERWELGEVTPYTARRDPIP